VLPPCAKQRLLRIHNTNIGLVDNVCLALELAKQQIKPDTIFIPDAVPSLRQGWKEWFDSPDP